MVFCILMAFIHLPQLVGFILPTFFWDNKMDSMPASHRRLNCTVANKILEFYEKPISVLLRVCLHLIDVQIVLDKQDIIIL